METPAHTAHTEPNSPSSTQAEHHEQKGHNNHPQAVFSWSSPLHAYKKRSAGVLGFYIAVAMLLSLIVVFFGDKILILPIWATLFLVYVLTITPPPIVQHRISLFGIETVRNTYRWEYLSHFYFVKRFDFDILVIVSNPPESMHLYIVLDSPKTKKLIMNVLSERLIYVEKPRKTLTDTMSEWLSMLMPEEDQAVASGSAEESPLPQTPDPTSERPHQTSPTWR